MQEDELKTDDIINADIPETEVKVEPVFGIRIESLGFLVSTTRYCEVLDKVQINALPNVHPWISGLLNLRGNLVPVFDLRVALEETGSNKKRRLITVEKGEKAVALWIDNYPEIKNRLAMKPLDILPTLPSILQRFVIGGFEQEGQVWLDIKFEDLFRALGRHQHATEEMA
jgi:twitching motility protein PilI